MKYLGLVLIAVLQIPFFPSPMNVFVCGFICGVLLCTVTLDLVGRDE